MGCGQRWTVRLSVDDRPMRGQSTVEPNDRCVSTNERSEPMRTNLKKLLSTAAVVAALAGGPAVYAYAQTSNQGSGGMMGQDGQGGMMGQGGQGGMMGMKIGRAHV